MMPRAKPKSTVPLEALSEDIVAVCEKIHKLSKARGWSLERLGEEAGMPFQSFNNWKQGHGFPVISNLQGFAHAVGVNVRVVMQDADSTEGSLSMASDESREIAALVDGIEDEGQRQKIRDMVARFIAYSGAASSPFEPSAPGPGRAGHK
jgi:transcriptional regulator with XRE-family HTH domain